MIGARPRDDRGFTLVELLVVIVVLAILAAIAVPLFLGHRTKAYDAAAKADLRNLVLAVTAELQAGHGNANVPTVHGYDLVATLYIDMEEMPDGELRYVMHTLGGHDGLTDVDLGPGSPGVVLAGGERQWSLSAALQDYDDVGPSRDDLALANWCIAVSHEEGRGADWMYTPNGGYAQGRCFG